MIMRTAVNVGLFYLTLYVNKRGNKKTLQTIHKPYIQPCIPLIFRALRNVWFVLQTIHKLYTKPYIEPYTASVQNPTQRAFRPLHSERSQNYTRSGTQTIHSVFEHESREWNLEREWSEWSGWCKWSEWSKWRESYVTFVTNVTKVTNVTDVTNVKQEMAIGGDATRPLRALENPTILSVFSAI